MHLAISSLVNDTKLVKAITDSNDCTLLQRDLDALALWCNQWKLHLNQAKCAAMRMSLSPNTDDEPEYLLEDHAIATPDLQRDLGIASSRKTCPGQHTTQ